MISARITSSCVVIGALVAGMPAWGAEVRSKDGRPHFHCSWGRFGSGDNQGQFHFPQGIAYYRDRVGRRTLVLADSNNNRLKQVGYLGQFYEQFEGHGSKPGEFSYPTGLAVDKDGFAYVCDSGNDRIQKIQIWTNSLNERPGASVLAFGRKGSNAGEFETPLGIAIDDNSQLHVVDSGNSRIQSFDSEGKYRHEWGNQASRFGRLRNPTAIAVDSAGCVYVTDTGNHRVMKYSSEGTELSSWGEKGVQAGEFDQPRGIAIGPTDIVYIADTNNHRIQIFDHSGEFLGEFGRYGVRDGEFNGPTGIACDSEGSIYVCDTGNHRFQRFRASRR